MGRIVVGVDGSAGARAALRFALAEARLRDATLDAVLAWELPLYEGVPGPFVAGAPGELVPPLDEARAALEEAAEDKLEGELEAALAGGEAGVEVHRRAVEGSPAFVLVDAARGADLLVVGSRGHGGFKGLLLGSVSQRCARSAPCPVAIVRATGDEAVP
jgi:nucleotide-binding universal stress UspA family protein